MELKLAQQLAKSFAAAIHAYADQIVAAGEIRREMPEVKTITIVAIPLIATIRPLGAPRDLLADKIQRLIDTEPAAINWDPHKKRRGPRYKRLVWCGYPLDLFLTTHDKWGAALAMKTGPEDFADLLVIPRSQGGALPDHIAARDGGLYDRETDRLIRTPNESEFFRALKLPYTERAPLYASLWKPAARRFETLAALIDEQAEINQDEF